MPLGSGVAMAAAQATAAAPIRPLVQEFPYALSAAVKKKKKKKERNYPGGESLVIPELGVRLL